MATISFTKDFSLTKKETVDRLEKGAVSTKSLKLDSQRVLGHMQRGEKKLLALLRSKVLEFS